MTTNKNPDGRDLRPAGQSFKSECHQAKAGIRCKARGTDIEGLPPLTHTTVPPLTLYSCITVLLPSNGSHAHAERQHVQPDSQSSRPK